MNDEAVPSMTEQGQDHTQLYMTYTFGLLLAAGVSDSTVQKIKQVAEELDASPADVIVSWLEIAAELHD